MSDPAEQVAEPPPWQTMAAPLVLFVILGVVYFVMEKEGREISEEDAYNSNTRNAGYASLPMMDLNRQGEFNGDELNSAS